MNESTPMPSNELFAELLKLLDCFDAVCSRHGLSYMLLGGTLLGAVRHKGFIPWDDDIDLVMPREDYDKLLTLPSTAFPQPMFLQTPLTDAGYPKRFVKLRNSMTTEIPHKEAVFKCNHGIFIDIFPLDAVPNGPNERIKQARDISKTTRLLHYVARIYGNAGTLGLPWPKKMLYWILWPLAKARLLTPEKLFRKCNLLASHWQHANTGKVGLPIATLNNPRFVWDASDFASRVMLEFEGRRLPGPEGYDAILRQSYGDYMHPVKQKSEHGDTVVDVRTPYPEYIAAHGKKLLELFREYTRTAAARKKRT